MVIVNKNIVMTSETSLTNSYINLADEQTKRIYYACKLLGLFLTPFFLDLSQ
jgi:hypothetical protein